VISFTLYCLYLIDAKHRAGRHHHSWDSSDAQR
jgi:hypothetical protein